MDRHNDVTLNRFEVLDALTQEDGISIELSSGAMVQGMILDEDKGQEGQVLPIGDRQVEQLASDSPSQFLYSKDLSGSQVLSKNAVGMASAPPIIRVSLILGRVLGLLLL